MNGLIRQGSSYSEQVQGLRRALDRSYARTRELARAEWERRHPDGDPSDACVSVRVRRDDQQALPSPPAFKD